jgi:hypothetical protein
VQKWPEMLEEVYDNHTTDLSDLSAESTSRTPLSTSQLL